MKSAQQIYKSTATPLPIYSLTPTAGRNYATAFSQFDDTQQFWLVHSQRYLIYLSTGVISDPSGVGEDVSLSVDGTF